MCISGIKVKSAGWLIVGISQTVRESIPFPFALDQGDYFASKMERHAYHQLPTLLHRYKPCYSYAELARSRYRTRNLVVPSRMLYRLS